MLLGRKCYRGKLYGNSVYALREWSFADNRFSIIRLINNMSELEWLSASSHNLRSSPMCPNMSSGASWSGDSGSTGNLIDEWLANLIGLTYGMALLEHAYQTSATQKLFKRSSKPLIPTQQESLSGGVGVGGRGEVGGGVLLGRKC